jgi:hypothetical protein
MKNQIDTSSRLKTAVMAGFLTILAPAVVLADPSAYLQTGADDFGTVDLTSGSYTQIGNQGALLSGMGEVGGNIYGGIDGGTALAQVNPATGALTYIGNGANAFYDFGSTTTVLYGMGYNGSVYDLFSVNPTTGATTLIGATGIPRAGTIGMSAGGSSLYFAVNSGGGSSLYSINTGTGAGTLIGSTGTAGAIGAMVVEGGVLYAGVESAGLPLYSLNTSTGTGTFIADLSNLGVGDYWGLVPTTSSTGVPDTGSSLLELAACALILLPLALRLKRA